MSRYRFIEAEKAEHDVTTLCRVLEVSRSAYYQWLDGPSARDVEDAHLINDPRHLRRAGAPMARRGSMMSSPRSTTSAVAASVSPG